ncbi:hypothetical protein [Streptomyces radicis]|uniref:hypothetical protein n=1 Tax=Streptomyces radicis TaxID=1750517 RepID=UPI0011C3FD76|nr:hypothetical protein [Streptomyces radicis]
MNEAGSGAVTREGDGGLEVLGETERPWSSITHDGAGPPNDGSKQPRGGRLRVIVHYVVIDGEDGDALRERQATAIRAVLEWATAHPSDDRTA